MQSVENSNAFLKSPFKLSFVGKESIISFTYLLCLFVILIEYNILANLNSIKKHNNAKNIACYKNAHVFKYEKIYYKLFYL